jgi:hypothetical protein
MDSLSQPSTPIEESRSLPSTPTAVTPDSPGAHSLSSNSSSPFVQKETSLWW